MDINTDTQKVALHFGLAFFGGLVRELAKDKPYSSIRLITGAIIGSFAGTVVYFICRHYNLGDYMIAAATSIAGYIGSPLLDILASALRKKLKQQNGK